LVWTQGVQNIVSKMTYRAVLSYCNRLVLSG